MISDVSIVGGGYLGMLAARELARAGARVTVFDRRQLGRESSWAAGGILSPLYPWKYPDAVNQLVRWSQQSYPELMHSLLESSGVDPEWVRSGLLILDSDESDQAEKWGQSFAYPLRIVDSSEIPSIQSGLASGDRGAIWMPEVAQVRNPRLLAALRRDLELSGVELRENCEIKRFSFSHGRFQAVRVNGEEFRSGQCLVTAGAWTGGLLESTGLSLEIRPVLGQMLLLAAHPQQLTRIVMKNRRYLIPRRDGRILVGSTMEETGFDKQITGSAAQELRTAAIDIMPALEAVPVEMQWAGLRPSAPDSIPYMGRHPAYEGLYICAGHFRNGLAVGPASARLISDLMLEREPILDALPYDPAERMNP